MSQRNASSDTIFTADSAAHDKAGAGRLTVAHTTILLQILSDADLLQKYTLSLHTLVRCTLNVDTYSDLHVV
jgi:hypothetical protein